jgi:arginine-tRNA-protein transferase
MKYYLANQLIAVGVIDVLPMSISSVYFFHEPKFRKYSLGIYGVVKEIEFMKEMQSKGHPFF